MKLGKDITSSQLSLFRRPQKVALSWVQKTCGNARIMVKSHSFDVFGWHDIGASTDKTIVVYGPASDGQCWQYNFSPERVVVHKLNARATMSQKPPISIGLADLVAVCR